MTRDEALARFSASVIGLWQDTPADELRAIGAATLVLQLGTEAVVTPAPEAPWSEPETR